jgi:hypothetical protein
MLAALNDIYSTDEKKAPREIIRANISLLDTIGTGNFGEVS